MESSVYPESENSNMRIVNAEHKITALETRVLAVERDVVKLETSQAASDIADARKDEQWKGTVIRLDKIDGNLLWIVRLLIGGMVLAIMAFVWKGGLNVPPGGF